MFYNEYNIAWWSWRRNWVEAKGYERNILEENDDRLIWEFFCKNKRNWMLPFVKWKACAFSSRAIAYIKTQLHWTSLNNYAFTNDVNKKDFRQITPQPYFPFINFSTRSYILIFECLILPEANFPQKTYLALWRQVLEDGVHEKIWGL